ncbi:MAG: hypothetical protein D6739_03885, partial [Nitrospirae bacterium]
MGARAPRRCTAWAAWLLALLAAAACAVNPVTGKRQIALLSEAEEVALGAREHPQILEQYGRLEAPAVQAYVARVGRELAARSHRPDLTYHFTVLDSPILNAFALPGGYVYVTRGLLAALNDEAELAGVLGHEIGHVTARHGVTRYTQQAGYQLLKGLAVLLEPGLANWTRLSDLAFTAAVRGYGRKEELQADALGLEYAAAAGYDTRELHHFFEYLEHTERDAGRGGFHGLFATHPETAQRIARLKRLEGEHPGGTRVAREPYLRAIDGIPFGPAPAEGRVVGRRYLNPRYDVALRIPAGWQARTARGRLLLVPRGGGVAWEARMRTARPGEDSTSVMRARLAKLGVQAQPRWLPSPHGAQGVRLQARAGGRPVGVSLAAWVHQGQVVEVTAVAPAASFDRIATAFDAITRTLRPLPPHLRRLAAPLYV